MAAKAPAYTTAEQSNDYQTRTWAMSDCDIGMASGGPKLPAETHFTYGTPPVRPLEKHQPPELEAATASDSTPTTALVD